MQYTDKVGTITRVGPKKTEFPNGSKVTIGGRDGKPAFPGVSVSVQFDFDKDVWYSGILFEKQAESLAEGKQVNVKVWEKESGGKIYKNFAINSPKKAEAAELEKKINALIPTIERHSQQILALNAMIKELQAKVLKQETTTAFDDDFAEVHPDKHAALQAEYNNIQTIEDMEKALGLDTDDHLDISPDDIPFD